MIIVATTPVSALAFDVAWEAVGLDAKPPALSMPSPGESWSEREVIARGAWAELHRAGWAADGLLLPDVVADLRLLARSARELYGWWATGADPTSSVHVASTGDRAVLARLHDGVVQLQPARATGVADALVECLPGVARGSGTSLTAPASELTGSSPGPAAEQMRQRLARPRVGAGQFFAAGRDNLGARRRHRSKLTVLDTADGRYVVRERTTGPDTWIVLAPADRGLVTSSLLELLSAV